MRQYYKSDKKRREDNQKRKQEQKRLKRLNKNSQNTTQAAIDPATKPTSNDTEQ
jgi:hypothetical protein